MGLENQCSRRISRASKYGERVTGRVGSVDNLKRVMDLVKPWELELARGYYQFQLAKILRTVDRALFGSGYTITKRACVASFCALSPNNSEKINYIALARAAQIHAGIIPPESKVPAYPDAKNKALSLMRGTDPYEVLKGRKTRAFYENTINPRDPSYVTIDGHVYSAWVGERLTMKQPYISPKLYDLASQDVRTLAEKQYELTTTVQAAIWLAWKRTNNVLFDPQIDLLMDDLEGVLIA